MGGDTSILPGSVTGTLGDLVNLYSQVQTVKLNSQIQRAQLSAQQWDNATVRQNAQAQAATAANGLAMSSNVKMAAMVAAAVVGVVALYMIAK